MNTPPPQPTSQQLAKEYQPLLDDLFLVDIYTYLTAKVASSSKQSITTEDALKLMSVTGQVRDLMRWKRDNNK